jgi:translation initiation factor IF-1
MSDVRIEAQVVIREVMGDRVARAALPNGKEIVAYTRKRDSKPQLLAGDRWTVLLSLCDFNRGRLVQLAPPDLSFAGASRD